jgi:hypothetical protein
LYIPEEAKENLWNLPEIYCEKIEALMKNLSEVEETSKPLKVPPGIDVSKIFYFALLILKNPKELLFRLGFTFLHKVLITETEETTVYYWSFAFESEELETPVVISAEHCNHFDLKEIIDAISVVEASSQLPENTLMRKILGN